MNLHPVHIQLYYNVPAEQLLGNINKHDFSVFRRNTSCYMCFTNDAGSFHRSVCTNYLFYNKDGTIKRVIMTSEAVKQLK